MDITIIILTVLGLCLFEIINSIDNAVINAQVLSSMNKKSRKWFLLWGLLFAVFVVRGLLPWFIVWINNTSLGLIGSFTAAFSGNASVLASVESSAPFMLVGAGVFLFLLFMNWLFLEEKDYGLPGERFVQSQKGLFFIVSFAFIAFIIWTTLKISSMLSLGAVVGFVVFFIVNWFKSRAERTEKQLIKGKANMTDLNKIFYLEILDATFSIDGVLGAFAFTLAVPLIILGNGLGAFVVRQLTVGNIDRIKKYVFLKNGAMYSIFVLGCFMILDATGYNIPTYFAPISTFLIVGYFFYKSKKRLKYFEEDIEAAFSQK